MSVDKYMDFINSDEVNDRIEELQDDLEGAPENEDLKEELRVLEEFNKECSTVGNEWEAIRYSHFMDYVQEMVEDSYDLKIPTFVEVDWEATARNVQYDYTPVEFDGVDYWVRER